MPPTKLRNPVCILFENSKRGCHFTFFFSFCSCIFFSARFFKNSSFFFSSFTSGILSTSRSVNCGNFFKIKKMITANEKNMRRSGKIAYIKTIFLIQIPKILFLLRLFHKVLRQHLEVLYIILHFQHSHYPHTKEEYMYLYILQFLDE